MGTWPLRLAEERGQGLVEAEESSYLVLGLPDAAGPLPPTDLAFPPPPVWGPLHLCFHLHPYPGTVGNSSWKWVKAFAVELSPAQLGRDR